MEIEETKLSGLLIIRPKAFRDSRGEFYETWRERDYQELGIHFVQDSHSRSEKNVLRGLHYQKRSPQGQLVCVTEGTIYDVCVDIRRDSKTFGQWLGFKLSSQDPYQLYMPPGFAHGFCVLSDFVIMRYKCTEYFQADDDMGIIWNDEDLAINWPITHPILSARDQSHKSFRELKNLNLFNQK